MSLYVEEYGSGEPIVFIHGVGGSSQYWYYQREYLKNFMKVVLVDLPGHGQTAGEACKTIEDARDAVRDTIIGMGIREAYIVGHSMGGGIAMSLALANPELVKGLILICTGAKLKVLPEILDKILQDKEATVRMIMMDYAFSNKASLKMKENGFKDMMKSSAETIYQGFSACNQFSAMGSLEKIALSTLIIAGKDDLLTPPSYSEYLHREIKGSELVIVEDAGHMVMIEQPDAVNRAIETFIVNRKKSEE
jgi:pimeloyl-ACP methyl ester carboxylesterase